MVVVFVYKRGLKNFDDSKDTAPVIAANGTHENIFIRGKTDVVNGFIMNGVQMSNEHDGSKPANGNEIDFTGESLAFEYFANPFEDLLLSRAQEMFEINHAETS